MVRAGKSATFHRSCFELISFGNIAVPNRPDRSGGGKTLSFRRHRLRHRHRVDRRRRPFADHHADRRAPWRAGLFRARDRLQYGGGGNFDAAQRRLHSAAGAAHGRAAVAGRRAALVRRLPRRHGRDRRLLGLARVAGDLRRRPHRPFRVERILDQRRRPAASARLHPRFLRRERRLGLRRRSAHSHHPRDRGPERFPRRHRALRGGGRPDHPRQRRRAQNSRRPPPSPSSASC